jgi:putative ABC transport system permease protein
MRKEISSLPRWAERFLRFICPEDLYEEIEGDVIQSFNRKLQTSGLTRANRFLFWNVIKYLRPGILLRNKMHRPALSGAVIGSYFLTSYRHALKDKINAGFKMAGLTLALFSLLVVAMYVSYQLSFDRYNQDYDRIYRVNTQRTENGNIEQYGIAPTAFGPMLREGFPEIETCARLDVANGSHLKYKEKVVYSGVFGIDSTWFDIFSYEFIKGSRSAFTHPHTLVLTETLAAKIFGDEDPLQKLLTLNNGATLYEVVAVIKDIPDNSHIKVDAFVPMTRAVPFSAQQIISPPEFVDNSSVLFVKFRKGANPDRFVEHMDRALDQYVDRQQRAALSYKIFLQPLTSIYLDPPLKYEFTKKGSMVYLYIFLILGLFLLVISSINYVNLSLAGFMNRSREMGVRKVLGGRKSQILTQITLDTMAYCIAALIASVFLLYVLFPSIREYIEPHLKFSVITTRPFIMAVSLIVLLLIIISAAIPAAWFASNKVTNDLKGMHTSGGKMRFNHSLLLVQFIISVMCIGATLTVGRQIDFIHHKDLGIDRRNLLVLTMSEDFTTGKMIAFKRSIKNIAGVTHVSNSSFNMGGGYWKDWYAVDVKGEMKSLELYEVFSDDDLFETLGMKVLEGRTFDAQHKTDSGAAFVINETAVHTLGLEHPVGARMLTHPEDSGKWEGTIVGVVNDININTLHHAVRPLVMRLPWQRNYPEYFVYVRIDGHADRIIQSIKKQYNELQPGYPLEVNFVDDAYNKSYEAENRAYASLQFGTTIILLISALGIFSLSIYMSIRKMKEFGIRKILGATAEQIAYLHVSHFIRIAALAILIALPLTYMLMGEWLKSFAYRVNQGAGSAALVIAITFLLIVVSAGYAAITAGLVNPVKVINKV